MKMKLLFKNEIIIKTNRPEQKWRLCVVTISSVKIVPDNFRFLFTANLYTRPPTKTVWLTATTTTTVLRPLSETTRVSQYQKDKPFWILLKQK